MILKKHIILLCFFFFGVTGYGITPEELFDDTFSSDISFLENDNEKNYCDQVSFYPNPVSILLHINNLNGIKTVVISDITGEQIKIFNDIVTEKINFETTDMIKGLYFITFYDINGNISTKKLIKK